MTKIQKLENESEKTSVLTRLIEGLDNEPENYKFTGDVIDLGHDGGSCVCGHNIRYQFLLEHKITGKIKIVGSTCVVTHNVLDKDTTDAIIQKRNEIEEELRKAQAEAKKVEQNKEIQNFLAVRNPLLKKLENIKGVYNQANEWLPYEIFKYKEVVVSNYKKLGSCIKALDKDIIKLNTLLYKYDNEEVLNKLKKTIEEKEITKKEYDAWKKSIKEKKAKLQYIGNIGDTIELKVKLKDSWLNTNYNCLILKFEDKNNNILIKWGKQAFEFVEGNFYSFTANVKKHSEWNEEKSTTINYLKDIKQIESL